MTLSKTVDRMTVETLEVLEKCKTGKMPFEVLKHKALHRPSVLRFMAEECKVLGTLSAQLGHQNLQALFDELSVQLKPPKPNSP